MEQHVVVNGTRSQQAPVISGVPQGSVLGPVLFTIFVNDMPELVHLMILMFTDDTKLFMRIDTLEDCEELQKDLDKLMKLSEEWQLRFSASKCKALHVGYKNLGVTYHLPGNVSLEVTQAERDLGVIVDNKLPFSATM